LAYGNSPAIVDAMARRVAFDTRRDVRIQWFIKEVSDKIRMTLMNRMRMATAYLLSRTVKNISVPVTKTVGKISGRIVASDRSKPGEFPRADTTQLMKTVFSDVRQDMPGVVDGFIGTPLDYGVILETRMSREFLTRTLREEKRILISMLTGPIK
jgi:hypothetical protein